MNLIFEQVHLQNFKALGDAEVRLNNRGIVMVKGVNSYEATAASNGSGKTSIFSGLFWALYGKTPEGISNPSNRYIKGNCQVELVFSVDSNSYVVKRFMKGSTQHVELYVNGQNQTGRNRTDTDKLIREDILRMSSDIFLSLVYLSQGFGSRLSLLTPTLRKDRLEQLTDTAKKIAEFSESVASLESETNSQINIHRNNYSMAMGSKSTYTQLMSELNAKIQELADQRNYFEFEGMRYDTSNIAELNNRLVNCSEQESSYRSDLQPYTLKLSECQSQTRSLSTEMNRIHSEIGRVEKQLEAVSVDAICPTCHQSLASDRKQELTEAYLLEQSELQSKLESLQLSYNEYSQMIPDLSHQIEIIQNKIADLDNVKRHYQFILSQIPQVQQVDTQSLKREVAEHESQVKQLESQLSELDVTLGKLESKKAVMSHCRQLITKQFRAYLLSSAIAYLNSRLQKYSAALFSNPTDCVLLSSDSQKLDITLGEAEYETLSGGEQRRVDLIMMLAQRDLALEVAGMSCNMLIMDEIMESMDETATQSALSLLESQSQSVDSMFIISHNDYSLPIDAVITVTKGADRVATVVST